MSQITLQMAPRSSFNDPNYSATGSSQASLLLNKQTKFFSEKQKLGLITFLAIHNYSKLSSTERQKGTTPLGLVSRERTRVGAVPLSFLQKRVLIFSL